MRVVAALAAVVLLGACGGDDAEPLFPADYRATFTQVRSCRTSADHDLSRIQVWASPTAHAPYANRVGAFPEGAVVVKEQFDFGDVDCAGPATAWAAIEKLPDDETARLGWRWQKLDADRSVLSEDDARCFGCHFECGTAEAGGYLGTCAVAP